MRTQDASAVVRRKEPAGLHLAGQPARPCDKMRRGRYPRTLTTTRRFCARPLRVALDAAG
jgi:hypothetical protein